MPSTQQNQFHFYGDDSDLDEDFAYANIDMVRSYVYINWSNLVLPLISLTMSFIIYYVEYQLMHSGEV